MCSSSKSVRAAARSEAADEVDNALIMKLRGRQPHLHAGSYGTRATEIAENPLPAQKSLPGDPLVTQARLATVRMT